MATTALARRFRVDVSTDGSSWQQLLAVTDFNPQINPNMTDATTFDTLGFSASEVVLQDWSLVIKLLRQPTAGVYPPSQEILRATQGQFATSARVYVRWYDRSGAPEAWSGIAIVDWNPSKTGVTDLNEITVNLKGDGVLTAISNPYAAAAIPVISAATSTPAAQVAGGIVSIYGQGFIGTIATTGVKFGGVNATSWVVVSDSLIAAVMPAGSAGSAPVLVTNAAGASTAFPYVRA